MASGLTYLDSRTAICYTLSMNAALQIHASTDFTKFLIEAQAVVDLTFDQLDVPQLKGVTVIELNNRFLRKAADARFYRFKQAGRIRVGTKYLTLASEEDRIRTFVHEAAHIADAFLHPLESNKNKGHGQTWSKLMAKAGYPNAPICTTVNLNPFRKRYQHVCRCGMLASLTVGRYGKMFKTRTRIYLCPRCREPLQHSNITRVN